MCGIAGLVDFREREGDLTDILDRMCGSLHRRGPDDQGTWVRGGVGLGLRRLSVIDLAGGRQPMVSREADGRDVALVYSGEIFNYVELRTELVGLGHRFETSSDTEVVLRAYLQWGPACAERFVGMFAFAVWDGRTEELVLIRDRFGIYPLYYAELDGGVVFGSELKALLEHPRVAPEVDLDGFRAVITFVKRPENGIFKGVHEMLPGTIRRIGRGGSQQITYWTLPAREHTDDLDTTVATVRELLEESVRSQLISDVPVGVFLSGGLDSSAIAALSARVMREKGEGPLRTFSVDYAGHADDFTPDEVRTTPDYPFVARMAQHLGADHTRVVVGTDELMDPATRSEVLIARDHPTSLGDLDTSLLLLCRQFRRSCTVSLTGDAADELFGGYAWSHDQHYYTAGTLPWLEFARRMVGRNQLRNTALLREDLVKELDSDTFERDLYADMVAGVPTLAGESDTDRGARVMTHLNMTGYLRIILDRKDRVGMAAALEGRVPFCDHRLVEYVYNVPWAMKTFDGREKSLLRAAVRDLLPASVLFRQKAGYPPTTDPRYNDLLRERVSALLADTSAPVRELLDLDVARAYVKDPDGPTASVVNRFSMEMALYLNDWFDRYGVRLAF
ncbi:asparagine synthase (glutamine-hydrolyzing) [Luedemannella helvata]|uniref:asparagine synthase (glutamine-hydrolyzing) n=1 Tax=Luedemannella helvata TaxID=349315 RepID=A0ABP4X1E3_9ACTN